MTDPRPRLLAGALIFAIGLALLVPELFAEGLYGRPPWILAVFLGLLAIVAGVVLIAVARSDLKGIRR